MRKASSSTEYDCSVDTFWKVFFDDDYTKAFYLEGLSFVSVDILEKSEKHRRTRVVPKLNMPKPVTKVLGDGFGYVEEGTFDRDKNLWSWKMVPNTLADKIKMSGSTRVEVVGENRCRRIDDVSMEAKIFGVGGLIESSAEKDMRDAWTKEERFLKRWLSEKNP